MENRGQWGSRTGFILAAIGSAIGLGNIWRFPYVTASNGGGAFLIPYFVALVTAGIPIMILEFGMGHKLRLSAPGAFAKLNRKWEWMGWWQVAVAFFISVYYVAVIAWSLMYTGFAFNQAWGTETKDFFFGNFLNLSSGPFDFGGLQMKVFIPVVIIWAAAYFILSKGIKEGIEKANKIFMPLLIVLMITITVRAVTLPGAAGGLDYLFKPDFSKIMDGRVWVAAYGQIFFTLSIAFAIMITYSSYLPKESDIVNNAFITAFGNCGFSLLAGFAVFGILGYMAQTQGVPVQDVASAGVGLAFIVFPQAINALPGMNGLFGVLFFASLVFAGMSSFISIMEASTSPFIDKFGLSRQKALNITCGIGFLISLLFTTGAGLYLLDITDYFINNYGVALGGLVEAFVLAWMFNLDIIKKHVNPISDFEIGSWWNICLKYITPALLGVMTILKLYQDFTIPYEGYPVNALVIVGAGVCILAIVAGFFFAAKKGSPDFEKQISTKEA